MENKKKISITKNRYRNNYQNFERIHFTHRSRYYNDVTPHWHEFYEIEFVIGKGQTIINDTEYEFEHAAICFLTPTSIHSYSFAQDEFVCYNVNFDIRYLDSEKLVSFLAQSKSSFLSLSEQDILWYKNIFKEFEEEWEKSKPFSQLYATKILEFLIMNTIKNGNNNEALQTMNLNRSTTLIPNAVLYIQKNFRKNIKMKDVADSIYLSEKYFSHLFHEVMGCTFSKYLTDIRLQNACHMLLHANDSVTEISKDSGFNSPKHFQRIFKQRFDMTPLEFRKTNR